MSKTCSLTTLGIWKTPDEPFEVYCSHHPRLVLFLSHCPSFQAARICAQGWQSCALCWCAAALALCSPSPALSRAVLCSQLRLQQLDHSFPDFQNYLFSLYLELRLALQPELLGLKPALFACRSDPSLEIWCWDVNCGVQGECLPALPWSRSALSSPLYFSNESICIFVSAILFKCYGFHIKNSTIWGPRRDSSAVWTTVSWVCWLCFLICISCSISLFCTEDFAAFYHLLFERRLWILVWFSMHLWL